MEIFSQPLVIAYVITWIIEFYLFGMQRATLLISRHNNVQWRGVGEQLLPNWYPITWIVRIANYVLLVAIFIIISWKWAIFILVISFVVTSILPIPYRLLYKITFRSKVEKIKIIDIKAGQFYTDMLNNTDF